MGYTRRILDTELDELFGVLAALAIDGAKGVGKTTTAEQRVADVVRLDSRASREAIEAEPEQLLTHPARFYWTNGRRSLPCGMSCGALSTETGPVGSSCWLGVRPRWLGPLRTQGRVGSGVCG